MSIKSIQHKTSTECLLCRYRSCNMCSIVGGWSYCLCT